MELFELTKIIFETKNWKDVTKYDKKKYFFIINRMFSCNFPMQAHVLQHKDINPESVMDFFFFFLSSKYDKTPFWMYVKGTKKQKEAKEKLTIKTETIKEYCKFFNVERKTIMDAIDIFGDKMLNELKTFEKNILKNDQKIR